MANRQEMRIQIIEQAEQITALKQDREIVMDELEYYRGIKKENQRHMEKLEHQKAITESCTQTIEFLQKKVENQRRELKRRTHAIGDLVRIREENKRLKALCQDAIDEINPHNPMAKKEMDRIINELAAQPQGGE